LKFSKATVDIVAAVATEEPETAANTALVPILVCNNPPGSLDSHRLRKYTFYL